MRVILQDKVPNLGSIGDRVNVKRGFARNYLIPMGMAVLETEQNLAEFEKRRAEFEKKAAESLEKAKERAAKLSEATIKIEAQAGDEGKLFGSVGPRDVAHSAQEAGIQLEKSEVRMPKGPLRHIGEYEIDVQLHSEVNAKIKINIVPLK